MCAEKKPERERVLSTTEAKNQFSALINFVQTQDGAVIIESHGRPKGALISYEEFESFKKLKEQERRRRVWKELEALRKEVSSRNADLSEEEAMQLADQFVTEVFQELHDSGRLYLSNDSAQ